jgi:hypothetical protein
VLGEQESAFQLYGPQSSAVGMAHPSRWQRESGWADRPQGFKTSLPAHHGGRHVSLLCLVGHMTPLTLISHILCPYVQRAAIVILEMGMVFDYWVMDLANCRTGSLQSSHLAGPRPR